MTSRTSTLRPSHARRGLPAHRWALLRFRNVWHARLDAHEHALALLVTGLLGFVTGSLFVYACVAYMLP